MMTRDEFVTRCDDLSSETKYSSKPWHIWLAEMTAHDAEQRAEIARLRGALEVALTNLRAWNGEQTWELYRKSPEIQVIEQALQKAKHALKESIK